MNWLPSFSALPYAWFFLLLIPLVLFYFLKLRRPRMDIPSLALWRSVFNDQRVNSPFQKFKRNILLLLQLMLLVALVLAAMQPFLQASPERAQYRPVLIDCSASMAALDGPGGETRLDVAKEQVGDLIDNMLPGQQMSLIAFNSSSRRLTDFTDNKRVLRDALAKIEVSDVPSRPDDALRMTQALARTVPVDDVVMYTDGNLPAKIDFELPFELNYQKLPAAGPNIGITALNARRSGAERWDVFIRLEGSKQEQTSGTVSLYQNGEFAGDDVVTAAPGESRRIVFTIDSAERTSLEVRLKPDGFDSLESDNTAYLELEKARPLTVHAPLELVTFRHALRGQKGVELYPDDEGAGGDKAHYDVVISDQMSDDVPEGAVMLYVGVVPEELDPLVSIEDGSAEIVDWQRAAPLLQHVQLLEVQTTDVPESAEGVEEQDYKELGFQVLAHGQSGPLILQRQSGARLEYYLLFHTDRSTLPYRVAFPILIANLVQIGLQSASLSEVRGAKTGVLPEIAARGLEPNETYWVTGPHGIEERTESNASAVVSGIAAPRVGRYRIGSGETAIQIGASLLDAPETRLEAVEEIQFEELSVRAADEQLESDWPLWPYLAMLGFGVLLAEWWFFQRRPARAST